MTKQVEGATVVRWREFYSRLSHATKIGVVSWNRTASPNVFLAEFGGVVVFFGVREGATDSELVDYFVKIASDDGEEIDEFTDRDLDEGRGVMSYYKEMHRFFHLLKRRVSGADEILDRLISKLPDPGDGIPF